MGKEAAVPVNMIIALAIVAVGLLGFVLVKNDELSGVGASDSKLRNPHGRLVRTKKLDEVCDPGFLYRLKRTLPPALAAAVLSTVLAAFHVGGMDFAGNVPVSLTLLLTVVILTAMGYEEHRIWRSLGMSLVCFLAGSALSAAAVFVIPLTTGADIPTAVYNVVTLYGGAIGAALGTATIAPTARFARQFADGTVSTVEVSLDGVAARAYGTVEDPDWNYRAERP